MLANVDSINTTLEIGIDNQVNKFRIVENKIVKKYSRKIDKLSSDMSEESQRDDISLEFRDTLQEIAKVLRNFNDEN